MALPPACPQCGEFEQVHRVGAIVASQNTPLSWEMRAPPPPGVTPWRPSSGSSATWVLVLLVGAVLAVLLFPVVIVLILAATVIAFFVVVPLAIAVVIALIVVLAGSGGRAQQRQEATRRYQHALAYWHELHYCYRCNGVFLPGHAWQYIAVTRPHAVAPPAYAWLMAQRLAEYADQVHAPQVVTADDL